MNKTIKRNNSRCQKCDRLIIGQIKNLCAYCEPFKWREPSSFYERVILPSIVWEDEGKEKNIGYGLSLAVFLLLSIILPNVFEEYLPRRMHAVFAMILDLTGYLGLGIVIAATLAVLFWFFWDTKIPADISREQILKMKRKKI